MELGEPQVTDFWGRGRPGQGRRWPVGRIPTLQLAGRRTGPIKADRPGDGPDVHVGTVVSRASCERLGEALDAHVDPRRFRMLLELEGVRRLREEATWNGQLVRAGDAVIRVGGPVRGARSRRRIRTRAYVRSTRSPGSRATAACATARCSTSASTSRSTAPAGYASATPLTDLAPSCLASGGARFPALDQLLSFLRPGRPSRPSPP